jgi:tetratricopeptide (TPR) repeat protein
MERSESLLDQLTKHALKEPWTERRDRLRKLLAEGGDFRVKNDLATTLVHTGEIAESVKLLEEIETEKPGLYSTAANLGTAYELSGDDRKALEWIRKGIERNPDAHEGSEWLHVRILEAKLALAEDKDWLKTNSITGVVRTGLEITVTSVGNRGEKLALGQVKAALLYQLHERLQFVLPPDVLVGALLLDLGELVAMEPPGAGAAGGIVRLAYSYLQLLPRDHPLSERHLALKVKSQRGLSKPKPNRHWNPGLIVLVLGFGFLCYAIIKFKRWAEH